MQYVLKRNLFDLLSKQQFYTMDTYFFMCVVMVSTFTRQEMCVLCLCRQNLYVQQCEHDLSTAIYFSLSPFEKCARDSIRISLPPEKSAQKMKKKILKYLPWRNYGKLHEKSLMRVFGSEPKKGVGL